MRKYCFKAAAPLFLAALGLPGAAVAVHAAPAADPVAGQATSTGNSRADVGLAAKIRRAIVKDKSLSTAAHNVDVAVKNGVVTIHGEVRSSEERDSILQKARALAGDQNVADSIVVAPSKSNRK